MTQLVHHPAYLFITLIVLLSLAAALGAVGLQRAIPLSEDARDNYNVVQGATLTLLALLIDFTLSIAVSRYDQRKTTKKRKRTQSARSTFVQICWVINVPRR